MARVTRALALIDASTADTIRILRSAGPTEGRFTFCLRLASVW